MSTWNYVVTAHKPTSVSHSCVGHFTGPHQLNLIVAKCTRIEIHLLTPQGLQPMLDVPIYGRIATIELFRPINETQDFLFIATERCVLQWDAAKSELLTRSMGDVSDRIGRPTDNGQIGIVDPDCRIIGLHLYDGLFKVIPFDNKGQLKEAERIFAHLADASPSPTPTPTPTADASRLLCSMGLLARARSPVAAELEEGGGGGD